MADQKRKALPPRELAAFFESLHMLLQAGVPANECPDIIAGDTEGSRLSAASARVNQILMEEGVFILSQALEMSGYFPEYSIEMLRLGEESGRMETTSAALGEYYRQQDALSASIRSAISGPLLLLAMMSVVLIFLIIFVLPVFENVFASLGLAAGGGLGGAFVAARVSMVVVGVLLALILALVLAYLTSGGRKKLADMAQNVPFTKHIHYSMSASRLTGGLAMLLASGIPAGEALRRAGKLVGNRRIAQKVAAAVDMVEGGQDLGRTLVDAGVLEGFEAKILLSASRAGQTEQAMRNLSAIYARDTESRIDRLLGMLEPALVGLLSVAIGVILLSVMLPLTSIMSAIS